VGNSDTLRSFLSRNYFPPQNESSSSSSIPLRHQPNSWPEFSVLPQCPRLYFPPCLLLNGYQGCFPRVQKLVSEVDHTPPSSTGLKNDRTCLSLPPYALMEWRWTILSLKRVVGPRCWHVTARTHMKCGKGKGESKGNVTPRMLWRHMREWSYRPIHFELRYSVRWVVSFTRWPL